MTEHTTVKLARALKAIPGVPPEMIQRARDGYYHEFLSPLDLPEVQLFADLRELADQPATPRNSRSLLRDLAKAVTDGQYDASKEESDEWMRSPEGQETMAAALAGDGDDDDGGIWIASTRGPDDQPVCELTWDGLDWYAPVEDVRETAADLMTCAAYAEMMMTLIVRAGVPADVVSQLTTDCGGSRSRRPPSPTSWSARRSARPGYPLKRRRSCSPTCGNCGHPREGRLGADVR